MKTNEARDLAWKEVIKDLNLSPLFSDVAEKAFKVGFLYGVVQTKAGLIEDELGVTNAN